MWDRERAYLTDWTSCYLESWNHIPREQRGFWNYHSMASCKWCFPCVLIIRLRSIRRLETKFSILLWALEGPPPPRGHTPKSHRQELKSGAPVLLPGKWISTRRQLQLTGRPRFFKGSSQSHSREPCGGSLSRWWPRDPLNESFSGTTATRKPVWNGYWTRPEHRLVENEDYALQAWREIDRIEYYTPIRTLLPQ